MLALFFERADAGDYEYRHIARLTENGFAPCSVTLPSGSHAVCDGERVFCRERNAVPEAVPEAVSVGKDETRPVKFGKFQIVFSVADISYQKNENEVCVDYDKTDSLLTVRGRLPGDRIRLPGRGCTKTLKKLFQESKMPPAQRKATPVLYDADGVIAVYGFGIAERCAAAPGEMAERVEITADRRETEM